MAYGRRKTEKVHGTRNEYKLVEQDDQAKKYEHVNKAKGTRMHLLSGIVKCLVCGAGMYGNKSGKKNKVGTKYKDFF